MSESREILFCAKTMKATIFCRGIKNLNEGLVDQLEKNQLI